jgi:hypothetical protein
MKVKGVTSSQTLTLRVFLRWKRDGVDSQLGSCCGKRIAEVADRMAGPWLGGIARRSALSASNGSEVGVA